MGWRFYRRVKIAPGVTLNVSKTGASISVGRRGAHITFARSGTRQTVGIPGTGISYTSVSKSRNLRTFWIVLFLAAVFGPFLFVHFLR